MAIRDILRSSQRRYRSRLLTGVLGISLPVTLILVALLTSSASRQLTDDTERELAGRATEVSRDVDRLVRERSIDMEFIATRLGALPPSEWVPVMQAMRRLTQSFDVIQIADRNGEPIAADPAGRGFSVAAQDWLSTAEAAVHIAPPYREGDELRWLVAAPVRAPDNRLVGIVMGDLRMEILADAIDPASVGKSAEIVLVDGGKRLMISSLAGLSPETGDLIASGSLRSTVDTAGTTRGLAGQTGAARYRDYRGIDVFSGFAPIPTLGWAVTAKQDVDEALAPVHRQRRIGWTGVALGVLALGAGATWFARRETARLRELIDETTSAGVEVRANTAELSSASEELAATTSEQSAAVTQTSATMEELARSSASIAETVDEVAAQAETTRDRLTVAHADIGVSSERTLALAERVNDISTILELINDIADQTNLLALNAAIEAARAGEQGKGFAVVADEVRRLAERSKASSADISKIVETAQFETNATVMAMEKGAKQMSEGLALLASVTDATAQVRLTTQQQRSASEQVVETMEQLAEASQRVSATASQIAASASGLADLAASLEEAAARTRERF
jgi:methyl-accepting chemotaxis protein